MADKEEKVYLARLAEQAERYEGSYIFFDIFDVLGFFLIGFILLTANNCPNLGMTSFVFFTICE